MPARTSRVGRRQRCSWAPSVTSGRVCSTCNAAHPAVLRVQRVPVQRVEREDVPQLLQDRAMEAIHVVSRVYVARRALIERQRRANAATRCRLHKRRTCSTDDVILRERWQARYRTVRSELPRGGGGVRACVCCGVVYQTSTLADAHAPRAIRTVSGPGIRSRHDSDIIRRVVYRLVSRECRLASVSAVVIFAASPPRAESSRRDASSEYAGERRAPLQPTEPVPRPASPRSRSRRQGADDEAAARSVRHPHALWHR